MKTLNVAACVLLVAIVALLSAGQSEERSTTPDAPTFLSLVKVGDYVGITWRTDSRVLTVFSPRDAEEILSLYEEFNATEDQAKRNELLQRMREATGGNVTPVNQVTAVGADYIRLSSSRTSADTTPGTRDLYIPAWSISGLSRPRPERLGG